MKTILLSLAIATISISAMAQNKTKTVKKTTITTTERVAYTPEVIAQRQTDRLNKEVTLTAAQQTKAKAIYLKYSPIRANVRIGDQGVALEHNQELMQELNAIMTPTQKSKYVEVKAQEKSKIASMKSEREAAVTRPVIEAPKGVIRVAPAQIEAVEQR